MKSKAAADLITFGGWALQAGGPDFGACLSQRRSLENLKRKDNK